MTDGRLPRWTHLALRVDDIAASIEWYTTRTPLALLSRRTDDNGHGAWLGHSDQREAPFVLVLAQFFADRDPYGGSPNTTLGPFAHLGIELPSRADVDAAAACAEADGTLQTPPILLPEPIGYVCMVRDPDGNTIEFSHGQRVLEYAAEHMTSVNDPVEP